MSDATVTTRDAVVNDVDVRVRGPRTDADIAYDAVRALDLRRVPETVQAAVHAGHVVLTGQVTWLSQACAAEQAVRHIEGVRSVIDRIAVASSAVTRDVRQRVDEA